MVGGSPGYSSHGLVPAPRSEVADFGLERSFTLTTIDKVLALSGPITRAAVRALLRNPALRALRDRKEAESRELRATVVASFLRAGEIPTAHPGWHVDRVGPGWSHGHHEYGEFIGLEARDAYFAVCSWFWPINARVDQSGTVFSSARLEISGHPTYQSVQTVSEAARTQAKGGVIYRAAHGELVTFDAAAIHRAPLIIADGWRLFIRVGSYAPQYSHYSDHQLLGQVVSDAGSGILYIRRCGQMEREPFDGQRRSTPL
jgi:hypothetical protein